MELEPQDNEEEDVGLCSTENRVRDSPFSAASSSSSSKESSSKAVDEVRKNNISDLVGKSKKAAFSLWTLLHAKNCRQGVDRCSHLGCSEAKLMYLHHKTCPARSVDPCPTQHKGCQDARKLLAHYRRCRDIRARQSQNPTATNKPQQHVCLVCSLVARHAKFTLDRNASNATKVGSSGSSSSGTTSHYIPSLNLSYDSSSSNQECKQQPRFAFSRSSRRPSTSSADGGSGFQALQAAVSCAINSTSSNEILSTNGGPASTNKSMGTHSFGKNRNHRPRAESFDVRRTSLTPPPRRQQDGQKEKSMSYLYLAAVDNFSEDHTEEAIPEKNNSTMSRRRSLSCTGPSNSNQSATGEGNNDPLHKSTIAEDLQYILGAGS